MINRARSARGPAPRTLTFYEKRCFRSILAHFGPSRPHKWIRLEILHLWVSVSCQTEPVVKFYDQITVKDRQLPPENVNYVVKKAFHDSTPKYIWEHRSYDFFQLRFLRFSVHFLFLNGSNLIRLGLPRVQFTSPDIPNLPRPASE